MSNQEKTQATKESTKQSANDKFVFSTLSNNQLYTGYAPVIGKNETAPRTKKRQVLIKGGANVIDKETLMTPRGVMTRVSAEDYEFLKEDDMFTRHLDRGFVTVDDKEYKPEEVAENMKGKDKSAQSTEKDFPEDKKPETGKKQS